MAGHELNRLRERIKRRSETTLQPVASSTAEDQDKTANRNVVLNCGWGRLLFAHTFSSPQALAEEIVAEAKDQRDIALYVQNPHVVLSMAPQNLFLDPSHTYRLWQSNHVPPEPVKRAFRVRRVRTRGDAEAINRIYAKCHMVKSDTSFIWKHRVSKNITYLVAEDVHDGQIIGTVTGVDHVNAFDDAENGCSLWCLAVDPQTVHVGVGKLLVTQLANHFFARGRAYMDLSVMHDNTQAITLYEKLGFEQVPVFCVKKKNPVNEKLFVGPDDDENLNPYSRIIINEAKRRGIAVEVLDSEWNYFALSYGGRRVICRESLSELTSAIAFSRCDSKTLTQRVLDQAGLNVPEQTVANDLGQAKEFLKKHGKVVVKPDRGEQGKGISVGISDAKHLEAAIKEARSQSDIVVIEQYVTGQDLRIIVIDYEVVAGAIRKPPTVLGDGKHMIRELIKKQSRRREAATGGESRIPMDAECARCLQAQGLDLDDVLEAGREVDVRRTANLHTGGTIHDVTADLHPALKKAAVDAAMALEIPVVGLDFFVPDVAQPDYTILEANERPGLANHEPQPTAQKFMDFLFPQTVASFS